MPLFTTGSLDPHARTTVASQLSLTAVRERYGHDLARFYEAIFAKHPELEGDPVALAKAEEDGAWVAVDCAPRVVVRTGLRVYDNSLTPDDHDEILTAWKSIYGDRDLFTSQLIETVALLSMLDSIEGDWSLSGELSKPSSYPSDWNASVYDRARFIFSCSRPLLSRIQVASAANMATVSAGKFCPMPPSADSLTTSSSPSTPTPTTADDAKPQPTSTASASSPSAPSNAPTPTSCDRSNGSPSPTPTPTAHAAASSQPSTPTTPTTFGMSSSGVPTSSSRVQVGAGTSPRSSGKSTPS